MEPSRKRRRSNTDNEAANYPGFNGKQIFIYIIVYDPFDYYIF